MKILGFLRRIIAWMPVAHSENKADYYAALIRAHKAYDAYASEKEKLAREQYAKEG